MHMEEWFLVWGQVIPRLIVLDTTDTDRPTKQVYAQTHIYICMYPPTQMTIDSVNNSNSFKLPASNSNIATGKTSPAITPYHFFLAILTSLTFITR